jgi:uncharacterized SAM-binding protein YcdF (DUF218 family)
VIRRWLAALALAWLLGGVVFALTMPKALGHQHTDGVVVLTGGQDRIPRGVGVLSRHDADRLLISGVDRSVSLDDLAATFHIPADLVACCIDIGFEAVDTRSNARETANWVRARHIRSLRLVTNNWHMRRARFELARELPKDVTLQSDAVEVEPSIGILIEEYDKYLWRRATAPFEGGG